MSDYHLLLAREDKLARTGYDPRVAYHNQTRVLRETMIPSVSRSCNAPDLGDPSAFAGIPEGSRSDSNSVQAAPKTITTKRYVIVDSAQRDWLIYPNPYSNVTFAFGGQGNTNTPVPVYTNNPTYPSFALPPTTSTGFNPTPGSKNTRGFSYYDPQGNQVDLSAYNASLPLGNFIAYDSNINATTGSGDAFGTPLTPCNVGAIRLVRAQLPQTPFVAYPTDPVFSTDASDSKTAATATPYSTFATYPYLLFYLNEYRGRYYGPTEASTRAFAALTQCNRQQIDFRISNGVQYLDYVPWNMEGIEFQSPLTSLQKLQYTVADPTGTAFATTQPDNLTTDSIRLAQVLISGVPKVSRATLVCSTPAYKKYPETQLRVGDRVTFHTPTLSNLLKSPTIDVNTNKRAFVKALIGTTFPVLAVDKYAYNTSWGAFYKDPSSSAISLTDAKIDYFNVFYIPNFTTQLDNGVLLDVYSNAVDSNNQYSLLDIQTLLGVGCNLPLLNVTQQPVFTFELDIVSPDTSGIGGTLVN